MNTSIALQSKKCTKKRNKYKKGGSDHSGETKRLDFAFDEMHSFFRPTLVMPGEFRTPYPYGMNRFPTSSSLPSGTSHKRMHIDSIYSSTLFDTTSILTIPLAFVVAAPYLHHISTSPLHHTHTAFLSTSFVTMTDKREKRRKESKIIKDRARLTPIRADGLIAVSTVPERRVAGGKKVLGQYECTHEGCAKVIRANSNFTHTLT